jgi:uncharacterized membrane protein
MIERNKLPLWRRIALPASIVLNCFLVALIGGHVWRGQDSGAPLVRVLSNIEANLNERDAATFRSVMLRDRPRLTAAAGRLAQARRELKLLLTADPLDKDAAKRALSEWRASGGLFLDSFGDTLIDALAEVSPEGRHKVVANRGPR